MTKLLAMAVRSYGGYRDGVFSSANFAVAVRQLLGADEPPDGTVIARVLEARTDVSRLTLEVGDVGLRKYRTASGDILGDNLRSVFG